MGLIGRIIYNLKNMKKAKKLRAMTEAEWLKLNDEDFYDAVFCVCEDAVYDIQAKDITKIQKSVYSLMNFEAEVNNGGLCQFFVNSSRECAPFISEALFEAGATDMKSLFDEFISKNNINVYDLSSFIVEDIDEYESQTNRYDFDEFDDKFYGDEKLHSQIIAYARKNLKDILKD